MAQDVSALVAKTKEKTGESATLCEISDWNVTLNKYAKDGWFVKKCGTIVSNKDVIFWALLKKREKRDLGI